MKKAITHLALLLLCASGVYSQPIWSVDGGGQYNGSCRLDSFYSYKWDTATLDWSLNNFHYSKYNANRYLTNQYYGNPIDGIYQKDTLTYDTNGYQATVLAQRWDGSQWQNQLLSTISNNANGQPTIVLSKIWQNSMWKDNTQSLYTYDANGFLIELFVQIWSNSQWQNYSKQTYTNDVNGNLTSLLFQNWQNSAWVNLIRTNSYYNGAKVNFGQKWDGSQWINYSYDSVINTNSFGYTTRFLYEKWNGSAFVNSGKTDYFYNCSNVSGIEEHLTERNVAIYPNPFTTKLTIEPNIPYQLFDLSGREVDKSNLSSLPVGTYILKTEFGVTRLIKE